MSVRAVLFAFGLTVLAGLSTGIGSALAFYTKQTNKKFLSAAWLLRRRDDLCLHDRSSSKHGHHLSTLMDQQKGTGSRPRFLCWDCNYRVH